MKKFAKTKIFAIIMHLLMPGLGHAYWREVTFGLFIFLIMLIATMLSIVVFFVPVPTVARIAIYGLPLIFYLFTFVDLNRTVARKRVKAIMSGRRMLIVLSAGLVYQIASPTAPINFGLKNAPELLIYEDSSMAPFISAGELVKSSSLAYKIDFYFLDQPIFHSLPDRWDIIRIRDKSGDLHTVMVIGLPGESIEVFEGSMLVEQSLGVDINNPGITFLHDWPLTSIEDYSILVATLKLGSVDRIYELPLENISGKVTVF